VGTVLEAGHLPVAVDGFIRQSRQQAPEGLGQTGDHGVLGGAGFEGFQDGVETEARIGANPNLPEVGRHIGKAGVEEFHTAVPRAYVPGTEFASMHSRGL